MVKVPGKLIKETKAMIRLYLFLRYECGLREADRLRARDLKVKFLEVDRDLYFTPKKAIEIEKIREAQGWELKPSEIVSQNPKQEGGE